MVEISVEVFEADVATIMLADDRRQELAVRASVGLTQGAPSPPVPIGEGVIGTAMSTRTPVLIVDGAATDARVQHPALARERLRSLMVAPLVVAGAPIGVLVVGRRTRRLDARAERLLRIVADRLAVAIEQARLESEARELADVVRRIGE